MATSGHRAEAAIRALGSSKCSQHYGKEVIYVCEDCDVLVCSDCVTQQHKRHGLEVISNAIPKAKQKLQDFVTRAEQTEISRIKRKFQIVNEGLSKNRKKFKNQVSQIKKQNETLKKELDKIANEMVKTCHEMEHQNSDTLLNHQKEIQTQLDKLSSRIQEVKVTLQSGNDVLVYDTSHVISSEFKDLPTPSCSTAEFSPGKLAIQQLEHLLGKLNVTDNYQTNRSWIPPTHNYQPSLSWSQPTYNHQPSLSWSQPTYNHQPSLSLSLPANWRVMSEFTPYKTDYVHLMHAVGDKAWLSLVVTSGYAEMLSRKMLSVNQKGQVQQTLDMDVRVTDFCISPQTGNIWYYGGDKIIREVKDSRDQVKFTTDTRPSSICVTRDDHILVGTQGQIVKYTQTGQKICTTSGSPPVVRKPDHMSECPLTKHVAVVDWDDSYKRGKDKAFVSILNDQLQLLHTYRGEVSGPNPPPRPFEPRDVCYTDTGELAVTDQGNKTVVLVTGRGEYLQTLYTDSESPPIAVSVHSGALWVSLDNGKVKVLKND